MPSEIFIHECLLNLKFVFEQKKSMLGIDIKIFRINEIIICSLFNTVLNKTHLYTYILYKGRHCLLEQQLIANYIHNISITLAV